MLKTLLIAGLGAAILAPSVAAAQEPCPHDNRTVGTLLGVGIGALLGNAIGEHGGKVGGTIIGGGVGGVVGNQVAGASNRHACESNRYGFYDRDGRWVPNTSNANGYYDANGEWVTTAGPNYDPRAQQAPYAQAPAYAPPPDSDDRGRGGPADGSQDIGSRLDRLDRDIHRRLSSGEIDERDAHHALRELRDIRRDDADARDDDDRLPYGRYADLDRRLDDLAGRLRADRGQPNGGPGRDF